MEVQAGVEPAHGGFADRRSRFATAPFLLGLAMPLPEDALDPAQVFPPLRRAHELAFLHVRHWLASLDSNHDSLSQSQASCRLNERPIWSAGVDRTRGLRVPDAALRHRVTAVCLVMVQGSNPRPPAFRARCSFGRSSP